MELDDCQWVHCFLLPESENECQQQAEESFRDEEEETFLQELGPLKEAEEDNDLQELGPVKDAIEEDDSKDFLKELVPMKVEETEKVAANEEEQQVDLKQEVAMSPAPAVSLDRLKSLLASQLKACLSRVPTATSPVSPSVGQETSGRNSMKGSLLKCDHCACYFTKEELAAHLHTEICQTSFHCSLCSRKFSTKAQFTLHICMSGEGSPNKKKRLECSICSKAFLRSDSLMNHVKMHMSTIQCSVCGEQFVNNHKLVSHLMTHKMDCEEKPSVESLKPESNEEELQLPHPTKLPSEERTLEDSFDLETDKKVPVQLNRTQSKEKELAKPWRFQIKALKMGPDERMLVQHRRGRSREKTVTQSQISNLKLQKSSELPLQPQSNEKIPVQSSRLQRKVSKQGSKGKTFLQPSKVKASAHTSRLQCKDNRSKLDSEKKLPVTSSKPEPEMKLVSLSKRSLEGKVNCKQKSEQPPVKELQAGRRPNKPAINGDIKKHHQCSECKLHFKSVHGLKLHAKTHKFVTCCICARTFAKARALAMHMKVHKQAMKCDVCKTVLEDSSAYKLHMRSHQYLCEMCKNKRFNSKLQLQAHLRTFHNRQTRSSLRVRRK